MLSVERLKDALRPLFTPGTMPTDALDAWTRAYAVYAADAVAGPTMPASPPVPPPASGDFLTALDGAIRGMWMGVSWVGPGATGVTTLVPDLRPALMVNASRIDGRISSEEALDAIVQSIHTYTLSITVTVSTASGVGTVTLL